ncbi:MAG TPA: class I SAM-dependent methyltransferase [Deltaproteobacteria bacterium]|nr:class I SAM-dependent methyltransferase [Deltaproteobacteria bacterium]
MTDLGRPGVVAELRRRIGRGGPVTFAEFMEVALYWPDGGYYMAGEPWGRGGDYVTSLDAGEVFAAAVTVQLFEMWRRLGSPGRFTLVEAGAGRGRFGLGVARCAESRYRDFHDALHVRLVDRRYGGGLGPEMDGAQAGDGGEGPGAKVSLHEGLDGLGTVEAGCLISNELVDALPVHRVVGSEDGLREIYVDYRQGRGFFEVAGPPSTPELADFLSTVGAGALPPGWRAEVGLEAARWIGGAAAVLERGYVLTVDYGFPAAELYGPARRGGTLRCHHRHRVCDDPYVRVGEQDITAHVDFTALSLYGRRAGLEVEGFTTQHYFLLALGILEELEEVGGGPGEIEKIRRNQAVKGLLMPGGMGSVFKVLVQRKGGAAGKGPLRGFSMRDMSSALHL